MRHVAERNGKQEAAGEEMSLSVGGHVTLPKYGAGRVAAIENDSLARPASRARQKM